MKTKSKFFALMLSAATVFTVVSCSSENATKDEGTTKDGLVVPVGLTTSEELIEVLDSHTMVVRMESPPLMSGEDGSMSSGSFVFYPGGNAESESFGTVILSVEDVTYFKAAEAGGAFAFPGSEGQPIKPGVWYQLEGTADFLANTVPLTLSSLLFSPLPEVFLEEGESPTPLVEGKDFTFIVT